MIPMRCAAAALLMLLGLAPALAQDRLPPASGSVPELRRGKDGKIQVVRPDGAERGCAAGALCVGPGGHPTIAAALAAATDEAVIEVTGGTYREAVTIARRGVTLRGVAGRPKLDCAGVKLAGDNACLLLSGEGTTVENFELSGAAGAGAACIRNAPGIGFTLRSVICHGSEAGLIAEGGTILVERSEFYDNGWSAEAPNAAFAGGCASVTVRGSIFRDARAGPELVLRCRRNLVDSSTVRAARGGVGLDLPEGGETTVSGGLLWQGAAARGPDLVAFARDGCLGPGALQLVRVRIASSHPQPRITNYGRCQGQPLVLRDVVIDGNEPLLAGYVMTNGIERPNAPGIPEPGDPIVGTRPPATAGAAPTNRADTGTAARPRP